MKGSIWTWAVGGALFLALAGSGADVHAKGMGARTSKRFGVYGGILTEPFPSLFGINAAYNVFEFLRVSAGYGHTSLSVPGQYNIMTGSFEQNTVSISSYGAGAHLFVPGWSFSPTVGFGYALVDIPSGSSFFGVDLASSASAMTLKLGLDWQTWGGFNLGFGANWLVSIPGATPLPYLHLGWFF